MLLPSISGYFHPYDPDLIEHLDKVIALYIGLFSHENEATFNAECKKLLPSISGYFHFNDRYISLEIQKVIALYIGKRSIVNTFKISIHLS